MVRVSSCCCGCSLKTGTILIGVYYLITYIITLAFLSFLASDDDAQRKILRHGELDTSTDDSTNAATVTNVIFGVALAVSILCVLVTVMLIVGAVKERPKLIHIWFVIHVLLLVALIGVFINGIFRMATIGSENDCAIPIIINILLSAYFLIVVHSYNKELKGKDEVWSGKSTALNIEGYPMPPQMYYQPIEPLPYKEEKHFVKAPNNYVNF